jgi:glycosyltransferase involved in cell wall biosynthesis
MPVLKIMQCLRAPVGGLFRHVCDLTNMLADAGHDVGIVCDAATGGATAHHALEQIEEKCRLGIHRIPMGRMPGLSDLSATRIVSRIARDWNVDVMHGHGAKGGAYVRLAKSERPVPPKRFYTPHGGSLHYSSTSPVGAVFLMLERYLMSRTDGIVFESAYARTTYAAHVGELRCASIVVHNGVLEREFTPVELKKSPDDFVFVGELRILKGVSVLLEAITNLQKSGTSVSVTIVGDGPDRGEFARKSKALGIENSVTFTGAMPAREAFALGRILVVPSLKESLPYIVLEAGAAGLPVITTKVGGVPEIFGSLQNELVEAGNAKDLAGKMSDYLTSADHRNQVSMQLKSQIRREFSARRMGEDILKFYRQTGS